VICITLSADREVHRKAGWGLGELYTRRGPVWPELPWQATALGMSRPQPHYYTRTFETPQTDRDRLRTKRLRQLGDVGGDAPVASRVSSFDRDQCRKDGWRLSVSHARTSGRAVLAEPHNAVKVSTACPSSLGYSRMPW
jgi:hypothetical protein